MKLIFSLEAIKSQQFCQHKLDELVNESLIADVSGDESHLGLFHELEELTIAAKLPDTERLRLLEELILVMKYAGQNAALAETVAELKNAFQKLDLFVCMAGSQCRLRDADTSATCFSALRGLRSGSLPAGLPAGRGNAAAAGGRAETPYSLIVVERPTVDIEPEMWAWIANLFHMGSNYATYQKLVKWLNANESLRMAGEPPDALFDRFVVRDQEGLIVDSASPRSQPSSNKFSEVESR